MESILSKLLEQNRKIERDISRLGTLDDGEICSEVITKLRTFVEHISAHHYTVANALPCVVTQENIESGIAYVYRDKNLRFIKDLHKFLQACASHYVVSEVTSPRLIQKYIPYLFEIKQWMKQKYNVDIITNLSELSKLQDTDLNNYYLCISNNMNKINYMHNPVPKDRYYVYSCHPIYVDDKLIYEITLGIASDYASKFNRFIVFSCESIPTNYSIRCEFIDKKIELLKNSTKVRIVKDWCVSIRPCEFNNLGKILGINEKILSSSLEYNRLMSYMIDHKTNLSEIIMLPENEYENIKEEVLVRTKETHIYNIIDKAREIANSIYSERNLIRYLIYNLNNKIIKNQSSKFANNIGLYVNSHVCPFCSLPFAMSLHNHNTSLIDLIEIFGKPVDYELVYRKIKNKTEAENILYHKLEELFEEDLEEVKKKIKLINMKLHWSPSSKIENTGELYYIKEYENTTVSILDSLIKLSADGKLVIQNLLQIRSMNTI